MSLLVLLVFIFVYSGMILGRIPGLGLDRTGIALLGAIILIASGDMPVQQMSSAVDLPTIALLFSLMVLSAQFRLSGFYAVVVRRMAVAPMSPKLLLGLLVLVVGVLSALLANDIVCLAVAPILIAGCAQRQLNPKPFLIALACAANVGSAATLIGNPQNILVGQVLKLSFSHYLWQAGVPSLIGLVVVWLVIAGMTKGRWELKMKIPQMTVPKLDVWQTSKGAVLLVALVILFLVAPWPRELMALAVVGLLLCSRKMRSREMLGAVDWQLLVLFISLFVVNFVLNRAGYLGDMKAWLLNGGINIEQPVWLFSLSVVFSNLVSNVPTVMLLLSSATHGLAGPILALSSTLAGNLFIIGSIANIIVVEEAAQLDVHISWRDHARIGVPVTLSTLAIAAGWLWFLSSS